MRTAGTMQVDASNADQLRAWDGDEGTYWTEHAGHFERSAAPYHRRLLDAAEITARDRVLDIGCGTGASTLAAAREAPAGSALGVDLSSRMVAHARRRAAEEGVTNVAFEQADAQVHAFESEAFDAAISSTGAMFFGDPVTAFRNVHDALRPGGRTVLVTWQPMAENEWILEFMGAMSAGHEIPAPPPDAPGPFALSDPDRVRQVLTDAGFTGVEIDGTRQDMWFGTDGDDAHGFVVGLLGWMLESLEGADLSRAVDDLRATMLAHETPEGVLFDSAIWVVRASRP